jgi:hypothetical protein
MVEPPAAADAEVRPQTPQVVFLEEGIQSFQPWLPVVFRGQTLRTLQ